MKFFMLITICSLILAGCGKAEITSSCSLNGRGDAECTFKNSGKAKGSTCGYIILGSTNKGGIDPSFFEAVEEVRKLDAFQNMKRIVKDNHKTFKVEDDLPESAIVLLNSKIGIFSNSEVCSGIVEPGDIRQVREYINFAHGISPAEVCKNSNGSWADACSHELLPKEMVVTLINEELNK